MKKYTYSFSVCIFLLLFNLNSAKCEEPTGSFVKVYITNLSFKTLDPIDVWFNDSLVISREIYNFYTAAYKLYSKGSLKITSQIRGFPATKTESFLNILNDKSYIIVITFENGKDPASIVNLKRTDGITYEPYVEENIFRFAGMEKDSVFEDITPIEKIYTDDYSVTHLLLYNKSGSSTFFSTPFKIWINDELITSQNIYNYTTIHCRLFTEGTIKISAQLHDFINTKAEQVVEITNNNEYYIKICFNKKNKPASVSLLAKEEGSKELETCKAKWNVGIMNKSNTDLIIETVEHPIPSMLYYNFNTASNVSDSTGDSLINETLNYLVDSRDGNVYKTIKAGDQVWMAENLNYETPDGSWCFDDTSKCNKYGRLYTWKTANNVCPVGWHLPGTYDWEILQEYVRATEKVKLSFDDWVEGGKTGMNILLAGYRNCLSGLCLNLELNETGAFWCSEPFMFSDGRIFNITKKLPFGKMTGYGSSFKRNGLSVRCIEDWDFENE